MSDNVFSPGTFMGETTSWQIADALLSDVRHTVAKDVREHIHAAAYFSVLLEGSYAERSADFAIVYEPYTLVFHAAGTPHSDSIGEQGCRMFFVELLAPWSKVFEELGKPPRHIFELHGGEPVWLMLRLHREFIYRDDDAAATVESLLLELCTYAARAVDEDLSEPAWIGSVEKALLNSFPQQPTITELAREAGVHPAHLCKSFRRFRGRSLGDYVRGLRVQFACRRLVESDDALTDVASEAGFTDQSHMTRLFKRFTGYAPGEYRRDLRNAPHVQDGAANR